MATSAIVSHGEIDTNARETYGQGETLIRLGNGGAGATGLLQALADDYLSTLPKGKSITWVCNHSRNTQLALLHGHVDVALTYERDQEALAASEGWSVTAGCIFHDHFCLAGPISDPADVMSATSLTDAFARIATAGALFHSRADTSATMWKERYIWSTCGLKPWEDEAAAAAWYKTSLYSPADAITHADAAGAYLLTDRSTLLRQTGLKTVLNTTVFYEPASGDDILMNSCYALFLPTAPLEKATEVARFIEYLQSSRGQGVIDSFGKDTVGLPLFAKQEDGFARAGLRGGRPKGGQWVTLPKL